MRRTFIAGVALVLGIGHAVAAPLLDGEYISCRFTVNPNYSHLFTLQARDSIPHAKEDGKNVIFKRDDVPHAKEDGPNAIFRRDDVPHAKEDGKNAIF